MSRGSRTPAPAGVFVFALALLGGCATPQVASLLAGGAPGLAERVELAEVPFFPQEEYQCGPAALATVLSHGGAAATPESLLRQVYLPDRRGSLQAEVLAATRRHGRVAYVLAPRVGELLREVASGTPVLVLQNLAFDFAPVWHYAVVVGYDLSREQIVLRSGVTRRLEMTLATFERVWGRSGYWAMAALAPGRLPAARDGTAADRYAGAVSALERLDARAARTAYEAGLARWPEHLLLHLGAGNSAYALKDLAAAASAYRRATEANPRSADAWNNFAQALFELGRAEEAHRAAGRAVSLGGPRLSVYRETLQAIERSR